MEAQQKYGKKVQMGTQQRSSPHTIEIVDKIRGGLIGRRIWRRPGTAIRASPSAWARLRRCRRNSIGTCGRARRRVSPTRTTCSHTTGTGSGSGATGETLNNGTHEVDVCRWALGVDYPETVTAPGGRYQYKDDWQFYDTLITNFEYDDKMISLGGQQLPGHATSFGRDRGSVILGTKGSVIVDRDGYEIYDWKGKKTGEVSAQKEQTSSTDLTGRDSMTDRHFANFIAAIKSGEKLNAPIEVGQRGRDHAAAFERCMGGESRAQRSTRKDGKIKNDAEAMKHWGRKLRKGLGADGLASRESRAPEGFGQNRRNREP